VTPVLAGKPRDPREGILDTLAEMDEQIDLLRKRKVGAAVVQSEAVDSLHYLVKRARGDIRRLALAGGAHHG
jgi:hypothetical protein